MAGRRQWRVGLIGAGMVSRHHLEAWARIPEARVVAIADPDMTRAEERARDFGIAVTYPDAKRLLAEQACDAVDIAAPVGQHGALCRLAADRGVAILCQKPLAATYDEAKAIVADVGGRVRFMVHENWRFRSSYRQIKAWLEAGLVGRLTGVRLSARSCGLIEDAQGRFPALERQSFLADLPRLLVFELLSHHIDVLRWLCGELSVEAASLSRRCHAVRGDDTASIRLATAERLAIELEGSFACPDAPAHICDDLTMVGTDGSIDLRDTRLSLEGRRSERRVWRLEEVYRSAFEGALRHFVGRLADGRAFETEATDNMAVLRLVEDVYDTAAT